MGIVNLVTFLSIILYFIFFHKVSTYGNTELNRKDTRKDYVIIFIGLLALAFIIRVISSLNYMGYKTDINCFIGWADRITQVGFHDFYSKDVFTDYPPGYMYILYLLGSIRKIFQLDYYSNIYILLIKMPAICCDLITAYLLYSVARKHISEKNALIISAFYLLNPAIIINSAIWGQVDSVFTLAVVLMCYYIYEKKLPFAYLAFGLGILIKPQMLFFSPILIYGIIDQVIIKFNKKRFAYQLFIGLVAILCMLVLILPFGLSNVVKQYTDTIASYPYASINAYNFWTMLGLNWSDQTGKLFFLTYSQWGTIFNVLIIVLVTYLSFKLKENRSKYFYLGALTVVGIFTMSVRMHERYMFPAIILMLFVYVLRPRKEILYLYLVLSLTHFYNVSHVLLEFDVNNFNSKAMVPILIAVVMLVTFIMMVFYSFLTYRKDMDGCVRMNTTIRDKNMEDVDYEYGDGIDSFLDGFSRKTKKNPIKSSEEKVKLARKDYIIMFVIMFIYSVIALHDLGYKKAPETAWETSNVNDSVTIDFGEKKDISSLSYYLGNYENRIFQVQVSDNIDGPYTDLGTFTMEAVFRWGNYELETSGRYLKLISVSGNLSLKELVILDSNKKMIKPTNTSESNVAKMFDEQKLYKKRSTFRDSTYFDEIYHARTAYEFLHGLYSYENTHPPLGKIFISLGMMVFGVNPFGWRIAGTLFGIAMIPLFYILAKRLLKETWLSTVVCLLFTFDFMHFAQTRIATIDVFVTFFIILMYYFMYQYMSVSFYDTKLSKTFIPLGLSGISMGVGIACKWTGVYAGAGLGILFFLTMLKRFTEYRYALDSNEECTNGILHSDIRKTFISNLVKTILFCIVAFVIIPAIIYTLSYIPFRDGSNDGFITQMLRNQSTMLNYHSHVNATHPYSSWWYQWPTMYRPIWYYSGHVSDTISEGISAFGNPLVWWAGIPAFFYLFYRFVRKRDKIALMLCISYLAQYVPWFLVTRITFIYHYFPSVPFVVLMIGYSIKNLVKVNPVFKRTAYIYTGVAIILFLMFYPVLSGQPVNKNYVSDWLRWFDSWVLVS